MLFSYENSILIYKKVFLETNRKYFFLYVCVAAKYLYDTAEKV